MTGECYPRLVVAGLSGDAGKTLVTLGLALEARRAGLEVQGFKKGPDYIDAAWLSWATGRPARNLDTWMTGFEGAATRFRQSAVATGLNLVEGNRGVFDGVDADATHSTAGLARTLAAPVLLVVSVRKTTATAAALVLGCQRLDPAVSIAGVVLNHVAGSRHETVTRQAVESACGIPVLGALPRLDSDPSTRVALPTSLRAGPSTLLPGRHLGLVTPSEHPDAEALAQRLSRFVGEHVDVRRALDIARQAPRLPGAEEREHRHAPAEAPDYASTADGAACSVVGYLRDSAFSFYYPENLEALETLGARLVPISSLTAPALPCGLDALYIGGGFPETHAARLAANRGLLDSIAREAAGGLPIYAECGGLMLLARSITWRGERHEMANVLPLDIEVLERPKGHGYALLEVDRSNAFFPVGTKLRGHEFHYSEVVHGRESTVEGREHGGGALPFPTACAVERGVGLGAGRDAVVINHVWASYTHLHADACPGWASAMIAAARRFSANDR